MNQTKIKILQFIQDNPNSTVEKIAIATNEPETKVTALKESGEISENFSIGTTRVYNLSSKGEDYLSFCKFLSDEKQARIKAEKINFWLNIIGLILMTATLAATIWFGSR